MKQLSGLNKTGGKVVLWFLILSMFGFTVIRSLHFLEQTFPPDQQYVAYLALAAFDVGVLGWLYYAMHSASGVNQRVVAYGMIFVCSAGVIITTIADMLMVSDKNGVISSLPPGIAEIALWSVMIVIALNFFAGILVHLVDTSHAKHMAMEGALDQITSASLASIAAKAGEIAPRIAERVAKQWEDEVVRELIGHLPPVAQVAAAMTSANAAEAKTVEGSISMAQTATPSTPPAGQNDHRQNPGMTVEDAIHSAEQNGGNVVAPPAEPAKKKRGRPAKVKQDASTPTV